MTEESTKGVCVCTCCMYMDVSPCVCIVEWALGICFIVSVLCVSMLAPEETYFSSGVKGSTHPG